MAVPGDNEFGRNSPAALILLAFVREQISALSEQEALVRLGVPDSVHQMRVVTRRLRSVFATYRALLDIDFVDQIREELKWLGLILGAERDGEVMRQRFIELMATEPTESDFESTIRQLIEQLTVDLSAAHLLVLGTLDDKRYVQLLKDLNALLAEPPLTLFATEPIKKIVPNLIREDWNRLNRAVAGLEAAPIDRESALHEIRKRTKRLRYAAETAELVHIKGANRLANAAAGVQTILGNYHDSIVARDLLCRVGAKSTATDTNYFGFEHLIAIEEREAENLEIEFRKAWKRFPRF